MAPDTRPLVMHVVFRFDTGGLENGIVNLINHMPAHAYRHTVLALTEVTDFSRRIFRSDVEFIAMHQPPGHGFWQYPRLFRLFRQKRPAIVHSRNLAALESLVPAWLAGVRVRIHGEHGRDVSDLDGTNRRYQWLRRLYRPFVGHYLALSRDLADYLVSKAGVPVRRVTQVYNGVDAGKFRPAKGATPAIPGCPFGGAELWLIGTVGRMQAVKDQTLLARAFATALTQRPDLRTKLRLVLVGDGPLKQSCEQLLQAAGVRDLCWLPGERSDVAEVMRGLNCFVLPSLAEGISNTILEAMASGLPVVATGVGGNADLVVHGETGEIVPPADIQAMADCLIRLADEPIRAQAMGRAGRQRAEHHFSIQAMVATYQGIYDGQLHAAGGSTRANH